MGVRGIGCVSWLGLSVCLCEAHNVNLKLFIGLVLAMLFCLFVFCLLFCWMRPATLDMSVNQISWKTLS